MKVLRRLVAVLVLATTLAACSTDDNEKLVVYSGRNENLVRPILEEFARETGIDISVRYGDTSELAPTILEEGRDTRADVFFSQDAGALAALAGAKLFRRLPADLPPVDARFRDPGGLWTGVTARARVIAYNTTKVPAADLPQSVFQVTEPRWRGRVGIAPTNASFVGYVSALIDQAGEARAREFLTALRANDVKRFDNNVLILDALASGEIDLGLTNHYYLYGEFRERPGAPVANHYPGQGDAGEGTFINVAGVGILADTDQREAAEQLVAFLLGRRAQEYFRDETTEYPLAQGVSAIPELPPLGQLKTIDVPLTQLGRDLSRSVELIKDVGLS